MDAIEMLSGEHRDVEELFDRYGATESAAERHAIVGMLGRDLSKHAALEEEMLYPLMTRLAPELDLGIERRLHIHTGIKRTLINLSATMMTGDPAFAGRLVATLHEQVRVHAQLDESGLLPRLRDLIDQRECDELGTLLVEAKKIAPEEVRIKSPTDRPSLALTIPIATFCDRLQDRRFRRLPRDG